MKHTPYVNVHTGKPLPFYIPTRSNMIVMLAAVVTGSIVGMTGGYCEMGLLWTIGTSFSFGLLLTLFL